MNKENVSLEIGFVTTAKAEDVTTKISKKNKESGGSFFENFESQNTLSFEPNTTGVLMQLDGLSRKNIQSKNDIAAAKEIIKVEIEEIPLKSKNKNKRKEQNDFENLVGTGTIDKTQQEEVTYEIILGEENDILPIWFLELGFERSKSICLISTSGVDYKGRKGSWHGSGFLISDNILLTNFHVLNSKSVSENAICTFNFQTDSKGKIRSSKTYQLNPSRLFISSPETQLDFTIVWIDGEPGKEFGSIPLLRHAFTVKEKDVANIIQHPSGKIKSIALQNNKIIYVNETVIRYETDTLPGSSGGLVANNEWKAVALHHASRELKKPDLVNFEQGIYINEGIKLSAIATYLEFLSKNGTNNEILDVLKLFNDTDAMLGYFGGLGRIPNIDHESDGLERVVEIYKGEAKDIDIAFWNIEWFNKHYVQKIEDVAKVIVRMNLDVWVFEESSPQATEKLIEYLKKEFQLEYDWSASEKTAFSGKQTTTIIWNSKTVEIKEMDWSDKVKKWLALDSNGIETTLDLVLESNLVFEKVDGKIFDRYPGLFYLKSKNRKKEDEFNAFIVPLHLKAMGEGSKRRKLASKILTAAVTSMINDEGMDNDWILGGDYNATLASQDFDFLLDNKFTAISVNDEKAGEMTYIKGKYKSLIDHIFISPNLVETTNSEFIIVANEKVIPDYLSISDHRPVLIGLSLKDEKIPIEQDEKIQKADDDLVSLLNKMNKRKSINKTQKKKPSILEEDLINNLSVLENNRNKEYYDENLDKRKRTDYYGTLPSNISPAEMFNFLNKLLTKTHKNQLAYKPSKYLYPWVDLQPDKSTIHNIYDGGSTTPESLIQADYETELKMTEAFYERFPNAGDGFESTMDEEELDFFETLESSFSFNCEHVVPQSWFKKQNPMRGDLHHLFSCTPNCNSFRGNIPYFDFPDWEERVMDNCGKREVNSFEPKEGKGLVARATLYFLIRYPKIISQYSTQDLINLLEWHINEPPSVYERHRNFAIQELQGNRNPLIDFPRLSSKIEFSKGLK